MERAKAPALATKAHEAEKTGDGSENARDPQRQRGEGAGVSLRGIVETQGLSGAVSRERVETQGLAGLEQRRLDGRDYVVKYLCA